MMLSEGLSKLEQRLREAGPSGRQLRYMLLRHFSELVQPLTRRLTSDSAQEAAPPSPEPERMAQAPAQEADELPPHGHIDGPIYARCAGRPERLSRRVRWAGRTMWPCGSKPCRCGAACFVVFGHDRGRLSACAGLFRRLAAEGRPAALRPSGTRPVRGPGLLCITAGKAQLSCMLGEQFGPHLQEQHCQMQKQERVVSVLSDGR